MIIKNVNVFNENGTFEMGSIHIEDGIIKEVSNKIDLDTGDLECIDGKGAYAIPGLVDLHFHGCMGYDFCDDSLEAVEEIAKYEASIGVTTIIPATLTLTTEELESILKTAVTYNEKFGKSPYRSDLVGINMEGPFISVEKKGAQDPNNIKPIDYSLYRRFQDAAQGLVTFMGIAPEKEGAIEFINEAKKDTQISIAHTNANYDQTKAAIDAGASHVVHLYNAMPLYTHREPSVIGAIFDSKDVHAELICDGVHIHPAVVRNTLLTMGEDRVAFISDSMRATGMEDGDYLLGGLEVSVIGNKAVLKSNGAIAGSATNLLECMKNAVRDMEVPLEVAVKCASVNPAKHAKIYDKYGSISKGKHGNIVLLDKDLNLEMVVKDGVVITNNNN